MRSIPIFLNLLIIIHRDLGHFRKAEKKHLILLFCFLRKKVTINSHFFLLLFDHLHSATYGHRIRAATPGWFAQYG